MGGFRRINDAGGDLADPDIKLYTTYTWDIQKIFAKVAASDETLIMLRDASTPTFTVAKESYVGVNLEYKYAKNITWDDIKLTWYDTGMIDYIREWRSTVWTADQGLKPASSYKKDTVLRCFLPGPEGSKEHFGWKLIGSWPSQISSGELTYTNSDAKIVEVTVTYDWADELNNKKMVEAKLA